MKRKMVSITASVMFSSTAPALWFDRVWCGLDHGLDAERQVSRRTLYDISLRQRTLNEVTPFLMCTIFRSARRLSAKLVLLQYIYIYSTNDSNKNQHAKPGTRDQGGHFENCHAKFVAA